MKRAERTIAQVRRIYIFTTLFLVALTIYVFTQILGLAEASRLVTHADKVNLSLGKTLVYILNAETNQRGFLLTGDSALLRQKDADLGLMNTELLRLDTLSQGNPRLLQKTATLHSVINDKLASMRKVLSTTAPGTVPAPYREEIRTGVGKMNSVRATVKLMVDSEKVLLDEKTREFSMLEWLTPVLIVLLFLGSLLIL